MPRAFDSDARDGHLRFTEQVECPACELEFAGDFGDDSDTVEDMVDAPEGRHTCPGCGFVWWSRMTGWLFFSEAG